MREAIALLLYQPALAEAVEDIPFRSRESVPGLALLTELLELLQRQPGLNTGAILEHWRGRDEARHLEKLAHWNPLAEDLDLAAELNGLLGQISRQVTERRISQLLENEQQKTLDDKEKQELKELLQARGSVPGSRV